MSKQLLAPGNYPAKTNAKMVVYETEKTGSLCVAVPVSAYDAEGNVIWQGKTTITLGKADGTLMTKSIENLKKCFPEWDGVNPFGLEEIEAGVNELSIVGEHEDYTPEATDENPDPQPVTSFKIKWLNPPGGGAAAMKEPLGEADRKKVLTKWSGKFKAIAGKPAAAATKPAAASTPPAKPAAAKAPPTPPSRKPAKAARSSSQEEVWTSLKKANAEATDEEMAEKFYAAQDEVAPGANGELTAEQWGEVAAKLEV